MTYSRPWLSYEQQLQQLKDRGMQVSDDAAALSYLERIGYYRLSAYWYPFRHFEVVQDAESKRPRSVSTDTFVANTHFTDAAELYLFDKKLRLLLTDALERIEVSLRVNIAYHLGRHDTFGHIHESALNPSFTRKPYGRNGMTNFENWVSKYRGLIDRSKEDFIAHYHKTHGPELPVWVAVEALDFGGLSQLLAMMKVPDQQAIASQYGLSNWKLLNKWVFCLSYLRNLCAHHSRLWNRNITSRPPKQTQGMDEWYSQLTANSDTLSRPFVLIAIVRYLMSAICPNSEWHIRIEQLLSSFPEQQSDRKLSVWDMGIPREWQNWKDYWQHKIKAPA